ncbi:MAG: type II toxin-antitoxin system RelE/ParE family toxin [Bacteroidales bacterium]|nr:type II toxin-antitoxin system RelE/ParE family toxin [Bacteroidales bacterium]
MKVIWSEFAENQLDGVFEHYQKHANTKVASQLVKGIINETMKLINAPLIGQEEELPKEIKNKYRYLGFKNYKIIYSLDQ